MSDEWSYILKEIYDDDRIARSIREHAKFFVKKT
jgi:hypothetical protein